MSRCRFRTKKRKADNEIPPRKLSIETEILLEQLDNWSFDIFGFSDSTDNEPFIPMLYALFNRYGFFHKFSIDPRTLVGCATEIGNINDSFCNPYHNNLHAADIMQTVNSMLFHTGLINWMSDLELFASLIAALIHDLDHNGKSNGFHISTSSRLALIYNDRSVLENNSISTFFFLVRKENLNILSGLSEAQYRYFRSLVIDLILATDMSYHFKFMQDIDRRMCSSEIKIDKSKALCVVMHAADISNPSKTWTLATKWASLIMEEFFNQGDNERALDLPISALCDRFSTSIPDTQIKFLDIVVEPTFLICTKMIDKLYQLRIDRRNSDVKYTYEKPWRKCIEENKRKWYDRKDILEHPIFPDTY